MSPNHLISSVQLFVPVFVVFVFVFVFVVFAFVFAFAFPFVAHQLTPDLIGGEQPAGPDDGEAGAGAGLHHRQHGEHHHQQDHHHHHHQHHHNRQHGDW